MQRGNIATIITDIKCFKYITQYISIYNIAKYINVMV